MNIRKDGLNIAYVKNDKVIAKTYKLQTEGR